MTEYKQAVQHYASKTKPGTYVHLFVSHSGKMSAVYNKTKEQNDEARFFCKNVVPMMEGKGNIAVQISIGSDGSVEKLFGPE